LPAERRTSRARRGIVIPAPEPPPRETLAAGTLRLRPLGPGDAAVLLEAVRASIDALGRWMGWAHPTYGAEDARIYLASRLAAWRTGDDFAFAIEDRAGRFLGSAGLNQPNRIHRFMNLGYWVRTDATGRGIATAATRRLARWGFEALGLRRVEIVVSPANAPSLRVAEKAGARREGTLRRRIESPGGARDAVMFSLIPEDLASDTKRARRP
jgi:RimJ/RimL family protein N-acetyltransferase